MYENNGENNFESNEQAPEAETNPSASYDSRNYYSPPSENNYSDLSEGLSKSGHCDFNKRNESNNNGNKNSSKGSKFFMVLSIILLCALTFLVAYTLNKNFNELFSPSIDTEEPTAGENDTTATPSTDNEGGNTNDDKPYADESFKLESVTAEEHYKLSSVYAITKDTVVEITTESMKTGSFMQQYVTTGAGSGVIISENGYIVTNHHVIEGATRITVTLTNSAKYEAILIGSDEKTDLAVLKIDAQNLSKATIGVSSDLLVGEDILVIGNPLGSLGGSLTDGIISATARQITIDGQIMTLLQTNAAVNPGNSGGAMFNMAGQLVGIVNAKYTDETVEGIGFAIPIDSAKPVIEDLAKYGYVTGRTNIGLTIEYGTYITSVGNAYWITEIKAGSDAESIGIKLADQIISINGHNQTEFGSDEAMTAYLDTLKIGDTVTIVVNRYTAKHSMWGGTQYTYETITFTVTLTEYTQ